MFQNKMKENEKMKKNSGILKSKLLIDAERSSKYTTAFIIAIEG